MSLRVALFFVCLAACEFDVDVGSQTGSTPFGPDVGPTVLDEFCAEPGRFVALEVRLEPTNVNDPSCWNDGVVPAQHTLPEETFLVLVASTNTFLAGAGGGSGTSSGPPVTQDLTLVVEGLGAQRLGDAPVIEVGPATRGFEWRKTATILSTSLAREERTTSARFEFDRFDLPTSAGQLVLDAKWACVHLGGDCVVRADRQTCTVTRPFIAQKLQGLPAKWTTPTTEVIPGATRYLVSLDLGALSRTGLQCSSMVPPLESTPTLRSLEVWQVTATQIRVPERTIEFPVAPALQLRSDFGDGAGFERTQLHGEDRVIEAATVERHTTSATLSGRACGAFSSDGGAFVRASELVLESTSECIGPGCAMTSVQPSACRVVMPWFALRLP